MPGIIGSTGRGCSSPSHPRAVVMLDDTSAVAGQVYLSDPIRFEHLVAG
jgi:hypothetical protein